MNAVVVYMGLLFSGTLLFSEQHVKSRPCFFSCCMFYSCLVFYLVGYYTSPFEKVYEKRKMVETVINKLQWIILQVGSFDSKSWLGHDHRHSRPFHRRAPTTEANPRTHHRTVPSSQWCSHRNRRPSRWLRQGSPLSQAPTASAEVSAPWTASAPPSLALFSTSGHRNTNGRMTCRRVLEEDFCHLRPKEFGDPRWVRVRRWLVWRIWEDCRERRVRLSWRKQRRNRRYRRLRNIMMNMMAGSFWRFQGWWEKFGWIWRRRRSPDRRIIWIIRRIIWIFATGKSKVYCGRKSFRWNDHRIAEDKNEIKELE